MESRSCGWLLPLPWFEFVLNDGPVIGAEGGGGEAFFIAKVWLVVISPGVAEGDGGGDFGAGDVDFFSNDPGFGGVEFLVFTGDREVAGSFAIAGGEAGAEVTEAEADDFFLNLVAGVLGAGGDEIGLSVSAGEGEACEAVGDGFFSFWVDVGGVSDIHGDGHASVGE